MRNPRPTSASPAAQRAVPQRLRLAVAAAVIVSAAIAHVQAQAVPTAPANLAVRANAGGLVTFAWAQPPVGSVPEHYVVDGGLVPGQTLVSLNTGRDSPVFTLAVAPGVYFVRVRAVSAGLSSAPSNEVRLVVGESEPPSAPGPLLGVVNGASGALSWTPTFTGGEATLVGLVVQGPVSAVVPLGLAETFEFADVPAGTYTVQALAANAAGVSAPSNTVTLTFPAACTGVPGPPRGLVAERWGQVVGVSWEPPATGAAVTVYRLFVYAPGDVPAITAAVPARGGVQPTYGFSVPVRGRQVAGALSPSWYTFTVQAENACGAGALTAPVTIVVP